MAVLRGNLSSRRNAKIVVRKCVNNFIYSDRGSLSSRSDARTAVRKYVDNFRHSDRGSSCTSSPIHMGTGHFSQPSLSLILLFQPLTLSQNSDL